MSEYRLILNILPGTLPRLVSLEQISEYMRTFSPKAIGIICILLLFVTATGVWAWKKNTRSAGGNSTPGNMASSEQIPTPPPDPTKQIRTFLLLGYGGGSHAGGQLTDSIMVARIDPNRQQVTLLSLPRDLWVPLETVEGQQTWSKINAAYAIGNDDRKYTHKPQQFTGNNGGGNMAKHVVQAVTGLSIDNYAAISFAGFTKGIDVLGGVTVDVQRSFTDEQYPIEGKEDDSCGKSDEEIAQITATMSATLVEKEFACRYESISYVKGKMLMDGFTALKFVRSRHASGDGGDFNRADRQRQVILAVRNKVFSVNFLPKAIPFMTALAQDFRTDVGLNDLQFFLSQAPEWRNYKVHSIALSDQNVLQITTSPDRQSIVSPKAGYGQWAEAQAWIQANLYETDASDSASLSATGSATLLKAE